ncbi:hypothetical protein TPHA_0H02530 [Tetrapisispora phaffii CBS 4417]|uniref:DNA topoisomerase (ATP-hydrolyzing) n=1 Tax=Tetrapisispora phaffii (strain ATCC 24235 / CBS 4417 / NBRC 1672 / NRRL Y-8282 / UCD 70-5) TaxID=1071381 RepID=G8BWK5_TETPH|nr:hypothetical protein TPHA_0H02530 [Tetrapisispora phaffii CBS 4417]CCE64456.1 hypothetical protein TPHA_0H02530 [Tetrapisispora phaffii CBS 4417]
MKSLKVLTEQCLTKNDLVTALLPEVRSVQFGQADTDKFKHDELANYIEGIIILLCSCIEYHQHNFEIILKHGVNGKMHTAKSSKLSLINYYNTEKTSSKLSIFLSLINVIESTLKKNEVRTIRDVYYGNVELYKNQNTVVYWLNKIQKNLSLKSRNELNIIPAQKGLCYIPFQLRIVNQKTGNYTFVAKNESTLIPHFTKDSNFIIEEIELPNISKIIVVEKEAVYDKFIRYHCSNINPEKMIIVTGKGYPDFLTRLFLNKLQTLKALDESSWEIYVDADPYGISIATKYIISTSDQMYSCRKLIHKGARISHLIHNLNQSKHIQLLNLTTRDITYLMKMISRLFNNEALSHNHSSSFSIKTEIQRQLFFAKKGEMNALY